MQITTDLAPTILHNGGLTWRPDEFETPKTGYMVSVPGFEIQIPASEFNEAHVSAYVDLVRPHLASWRDLWFGAWVDSGTVYLDISQHVEGLTTALLAAQINNQLAIYSNSTGNVITV